MVRSSARSTMSRSEGVDSALVLGVVAGDGLKHQRLGKVQAEAAAIRRHRHDLAAATPAMSGISASTSVIACSRHQRSMKLMPGAVARVASTRRPLTPPLPVFRYASRASGISTGLARRPARRPAHSRVAAPNASKMAREGRILQHVPFRMPLHREREPRCVLDAHRLDEAVRGPRLDHQPPGEPVDALRVQRVDFDHLPAEEPMEETAGHHPHRVRRCVLAGDVERQVLAMIESPRQLLDVLVQRPAERDVHFLETPAYREHRYPALQAAAHERQRGLVAVRVVQGAGTAGRRTVVAGQHVRRAAGEQETVDRVEQVVVGDGASEGGDEERKRPRCRADRADVLLLADVVDAVFDLEPARGDADDGTVHGTAFRGASAAASGRNRGDLIPAPPLSALVRSHVHRPPPRAPPFGARSRRGLCPDVWRDLRAAGNVDVARLRGHAGDAAGTVWGSSASGARVARGAAVNASGPVMPALQVVPEEPDNAPCARSRTRGGDRAAGAETTSMPDIRHGRLLSGHELPERLVHGGIERWRLVGPQGLLPLRIGAHHGILAAGFTPALVGAGIGDLTLVKGGLVAGQGMGTAEEVVPGAHLPEGIERKRAGGPAQARRAACGRRPDGPRPAPASRTRW